MKKFFNIAGPCNPDDHYMVPVLSRNKEVFSLIEQKQYFVIYAARQSGKTTLIQQLVEELNSQKLVYPLYCSLESVHVFPNPKDGIPEIVNRIKSAIKYSKLPYKEILNSNTNTQGISTLLGDFFRDYCLKLDKPLVVFFDEVDGLKDGTLIAFLRQLRDGFITRKQIPFLHSVALVGMRNIRDYKAKIREGQTTLGSASPFNIISKALTLKNFSYLEIESLYEQHTEQTGQIFEKESIQKVYEETDGQPWLVNAIAKEVVEELLEGDYSISVSPNLVNQAIENIILRRDTHIDSLLERLKEERVRKVIEPVLIGESAKLEVLSDDYQYVLNLGLIRNDRTTTEPANRIYAEVIGRLLSIDTQESLKSDIYPYLLSRYIWDEEIDMHLLFQDFQEFWRENGAIWKERYQYKEAAPHLILMAFLQRIINSGGSIRREMASETRRLDLCVLYKNKKYPIEVKIRYSEKSYDEGIRQILKYMDSLDCQKGWLVVFDRRLKTSWDKKLFIKQKVIDKKEVSIVGV